MLMSLNSDRWACINTYFIRTALQSTRRPLLDIALLSNASELSLELDHLGLQHL
jgi:hypothetical protein